MIVVALPGMAKLGSGNKLGTFLSETGSSGRDVVEIKVHSNQGYYGLARVSHIFRNILSGRIMALQRRGEEDGGDSLP